MNKFISVGVYGGGSWGTALSCLVAKKQRNVKLCLRDKKIISEMNQHNTNTKYLDNIKLPVNIIATNSFYDLIKSDAIILALPSNKLMLGIENLKLSGLDKNTVLLIATKGLVSHPADLFSNRIKSIISNPIAFISGPNFAKEIAQNILSASTIASEDMAIALKLKNTLESENFIVSITDDIITVQIAGAIKNIIAIRMGIEEAEGDHSNTKAWLITQGIQEIKKLSQAFGGKLDTLLQPAVIGDLALTCYSPESRNRKFGYDLAISNKTTDQNLVEVLKSLRLILELGNLHNIDLPLINSVAKRLFG